MAAFNALVDGYVGAPMPAPPPVGPDGAGNMTVGPAPSQGGLRISDLQGVPPLRGDHNIPLQVAFLGLVALAVVITLRLLGFKFSGTAALGVGR